MGIGKHFSFLVWSFFLVGLFGKIAQAQDNETNHVQIAFMADVHFQDIYGQFLDTDYQGILNPGTGKYNTVRTMNAQLRSTRIFNENYFSFKTALDDVVKRGIKLVALPGDFSDDGQPVHLRGLQKILQHYTEVHHIQFFATTGNHDPVRPFTKEGTKTDFLAENGEEQRITSRAQPKSHLTEKSNKTIISEDIREMGYEGILAMLSNFGFHPKPGYVYWETPFSKYVYDTYSLKAAQNAAHLNNREYPISGTDIMVPDASYLVEPTDGIWLLALDGNVYKPRNNRSEDTKNANNFEGASIGYNDVLTHKKHLIDWVAKVAYEAQKRNKVLIAFSHYPMIEFNDGSSEAMKLFFGNTKMQLARVPSLAVAAAFAATGLKLHIGGHMHINDTGVYQSGDRALFNIQVPSLAAYVPGYKILTIHGQENIEVTTVVVEDAPGFQELFPLYEKEHDFGLKNNKANLWNKDILQTDSYLGFTEFHLRELVRLRFIPEDWPAEFAFFLTQNNGWQLLQHTENGENTEELKENLVQNGLTQADFEQWTGFDMIYDFYRLRGGDELAHSAIGSKRLKQYLLLCKQWASSQNEKKRPWAEIFTKTVKEYPADHFMIDLRKNQIYPLPGKYGF